MSPSKFFIWLAGISLALLGLVIVQQKAAWYDEIFRISYLSIGFFVLLSILIYFLARAASTSPNKNYLTQLVMILVFVKILACLTIIIVYDRLYQPSSNIYVLPFFLHYIVYTSLEIYILTRASKMAL
ncbi:MAG: hypothetical protein OEQ53_10025 [Saprospiraceae bacterium]|nr:hypothetical protein [Saprospiraceae bacterium]